MNEEYYLEVLQLLSVIRQEMVDDLLNTDMLEESLELVAEIKATNRVLDRLKVVKERVEQEQKTLKGKS